MAIHNILPLAFWFVSFTVYYDRKFTADELVWFWLFLARIEYRSVTSQKNKVLKLWDLLRGGGGDGLEALPIMPHVNCSSMLVHTLFLQHLLWRHKNAISTYVLYMIKQGYVR